MGLHSFTLHLVERNPSDERLEEVADTLYGSGCDDAVVGVRGNRLHATFTRSGATMEEAVASARADVEAAGVAVEGVEPEVD